MSEILPHLATSTPPYAALVKLLERAEGQAHQGIHRTFEHFLSASQEAYTQWRAVGREQFGTIKDMTEYESFKRAGEHLPVWENGVLASYTPAVRDLLRHAWLVLRDHALDSYQDILGPAYEALGHHNKYMSQYFTPWSLARMMAQMTMTGDWSQFSPEKPCRVMDPCCGAGVMLLAAADVAPPQSVLSGALALYGIDLDPLCVAMTKLNLTGRGLAGERDIENVNALSDDRMVGCAATLAAGLPQYAERVAAAPDEEKPRLQETVARVQTVIVQAGLDFGLDSAPQKVITPRRRRTG